MLYARQDCFKFPNLSWELFRADPLSPDPAELRLTHIRRSWAIAVDARRANTVERTPGLLVKQRHLITLQ